MFFISDVCVNPIALGMADNGIQNHQITASSVYQPYKPRLARLNGNSAWSPASKRNQWIQVQFELPKFVSGIILQGDPVGSVNEWVTKYQVEYSYDYSYQDYIWEFIRDNQGTIMVSLILVKLYRIHQNLDCVFF